jgi:cell division protein FtsQ
MSPAVLWRRRAIALAAVALAAVAGYYLWLRDSSVFAVDQVEVEGATHNNEQVTEALELAAAEMTTLHIDDEALREAVAGFPTIATIKADADLPGTLRVTVTERLPVARVNEGGEDLAVAADGLVLPGVEVDKGTQPPIEAGVEAGRVDEEGAEQTAIAGAAPAELRERIESIAFDPERGGVVVALEGAPELRFGDGSEANAKWDAVLSVLSNPELGSPAYLDASVPERPVTGG